MKLKDTVQDQILEERIGFVDLLNNKMKLTTNQINKLKGQTFLNCWSECGLFKSMCIKQLKDFYLQASLKMIYKKLKQNNER